MSDRVMMVLPMPCERSKIQRGMHDIQIDGRCRVEEVVRNGGK